ncbi:PEP-CTERM sorting domain-containing protein [Desulfobacterales bacterium HSG17]|nr:PEP-CTERM sorting domain-containing protein [Desulfobacterales bacterium HSG17]
MKKISTIAIIILAVSTFFISQAYAVSLSLKPLTSFFEVGSLAEVDLVVSDLGNEDIAGFDLNIVHNPSVIDFAYYTLGDGLGNIAAGEAEDWSMGNMGNGTINLAELSWLFDLSFQADTFKLATLYFTGAGEGTGFLGFSDAILSGVYGDSLDATYKGADVSVKPVQPIPEPATMFLLGFGLTGIGFVKRKHKDRQLRMYS